MLDTLYMMATPWATALCVQRDRGKKIEYLGAWQIMPIRYTVR